MSLPQYADYLQQQGTISPFDAGRTKGFGGLVSRASSGLDEALAPASKFTGGIFGDVGKSISPTLEKPFESAGEGLPRSLVNFAPMAIGDALAPVTFGASAPIGVGLSAALSGAGTYEETGSVGQAGLSAASMAVLPFAAGAGAKVSTDIAGKLFGELSPGVSRIAGYVGGQLGALTDFETAGEFGSKLATGSFYNPLQTDHVVSQLVSQLPFVLADLPRLVRGEPVAESMKKNVEQSEKSRKASLLDSVPDVGTNEPIQPGDKGFVLGKGTLMGVPVEEPTFGKWTSDPTERAKTFQSLSDNLEKLNNPDPIVSIQAAHEVGKEVGVPVNDGTLKSATNLALKEDDGSSVQEASNVAVNLHTAEVRSKLKRIVALQAEADGAGTDMEREEIESEIEELRNGLPSNLGEGLQLVDEGRLAKENKIEATVKRKTLGTFDTPNEANEMAADLNRQNNNKGKYFSVETDTVSGKSVVKQVERPTIVSYDAMGSLADHAADKVRQEMEGRGGTVHESFMGNGGERVRQQERLPAGGNLFFSLGEFDPNTRTIGNIKSVPKTNLVGEQTLMSKGGVNGLQIKKDEMALYKDLVPEAFTAGGLVDVEKLSKGLKEKGPVVEVKKLGETINPLKQEVDKLGHELDTKFPQWNDPKVEQPPEIKELYSRYSELSFKLAFDPQPGEENEVHHSYLGPKSEQEMPGYVEIGVVAQGPTKFSHEHFAGSPLYKNTLGFVRGFEDIVNGKKVFHVIEVQSDWGQKERNRAQQFQRSNLGRSLEGQELLGESGHPLLRAYESLALKAAIAHAKEIGAEGIVLSDGETAMMTEGHDQNIPQEEDIEDRVNHPNFGNERSVEERSKFRPKQEQGMRLHYDTTLPSELKRLTGKEGESVELGEHKNIMPDRSFRSEADKPIGSPVFRDASGQPKTQITGRYYPLDNLSPSVERLVGATGEQAQGNVEQGNKTSRPNAVQYGVQDVAKSIFENNGIDPKTIPGHVNGLLRLVSQFPELEKVIVGRLKADVVNPLETLGLSSEMGPRVWLREMYPGGIPKDEIPKAVGFSLVHELGHQYERSVLAGEMGENHQRIFNALSEMFDTEDHEFARQMLNAFRDELLPSNTRKNSAVNSMIDRSIQLKQNAKTPEERSTANQELRANTWAIMSMALGDGKPRGWRDFVALMPKPIGDHVLAVTDYIKNVLRGVKTLFKLPVDHGASDTLQRITNKYFDEFKKVARTKEEINKVVNDFVNLQRTDPRGFFQAQSSAQGRSLRMSTLRIEGSDWVRQAQVDLEKEAGLEPEEGLAKKVGRGIARFAEPLPQRAERYGPLYRDILNTVIQSHRWVHEKYREFGLYLAGDVDESTHQFVPGGKDTPTEHLAAVHLERAPEGQLDGPMNRVISRVKLWEQGQQTEESQINKPFDWDSEEGKGLRGSLSDKQYGYVLKYLDGMTAANVKLQHDMLDGYTEAAKRNFGAALLSHMKSTIRSSEAYGIMDRLVDGVKLLNEPETELQGRAALSMVQSKLPPEQFDSFVRAASQFNQGHARLEQFFKGRPLFVSEQRLGDYKVVGFKPDGTQVRLRAWDSKDQAIKYVGTKKEQNPDWTFKVLPKVEKGSDDFNFVDGMESKLREYQNMQEEVFGQLLGKDSLLYASIVPHLDIVGELKKSRAARAMSPILSDIGKVSMVGRQLKEGREDLNLVHNNLKFAAAALRNMQYRILRSNETLHSLDPEMLKNPEALKDFQMSLDNYREPDSEFARKLVSGAYIWTLGMNFSSGVMMAHSIPMSILPQLTAEGAGYLQGFKLVKNAFGEITNNLLSGKWSNPEHERLINDVAISGGIGAGALEEFIGQDDVSAIGLSQALNDIKPSTRVDLLKKPLANVASASTWMVRKVSHLSHYTASLASYDYFRSKGLSVDDAIDEAKRFNTVATFHGGKPTRSLGQYAWLPRSAAQVMDSLQAFVKGQTAMMGRFAQHSFQDVPGVDRPAARKALVQVLSTNLLAAGVLGLPGVGASVAILEKLFPNLQLQRDAREQLDKIAGTDAASGNLLGDVVLKGLASQLGADVSSRLSLDNVLGTSPVNGFAFENLTGPVGSIFHNLVKGFQDDTSGQVTKGTEEMLPNSIKRLLQSYSGIGGVNDTAGNPIVDTTPTEKLVQGLGFTPTRIARARDAAMIRQRAEKIDQRELKDFHRKVTSAIESGDVDSAQSLMRDRQQADTSYDPVADVRAIAAEVEQRSFPSDQRRQGTRNTALDDHQLNQLYALQGQPPSELQRLQLRKQVEGELIPGLGGNLSQTEIMRASLADQFMSVNPNLSKAEAYQLVDQQLGKVKTPVGF